MTAPAPTSVVTAVEPAHVGDQAHASPFFVAAARRSVAGFVIAVALSCSCTALAAGDDAAQKWMLDMHTAVRALDYSGTFIYERDGAIDVLRIFHAGGSDERERLLRMSGARGEVLREGPSISVLEHGAASVQLPNRPADRLLPLMPETAYAQFARNYSMAVAGNDRVAGYIARVVEIAPRDSYRYGYKLWIDESSKLLLRSAVVDAAQTVLEQFMFVSLEIGAKPGESDLSLSENLGTGMPAREVPVVGRPHWQVDDLPSGFRFVRARQPAIAPTQAEHLAYSDGIANVSIYVEPDDARQPAPDRTLTRGVVNIFVHQAGAWKFTALGDVPRATVERMARSVKPADVAGLKP